MRIYQNTNNLTVIEFIDNVMYPFDRIPPFKIAEGFCIEDEDAEEEFKISHMDQVYFKFNAFSGILSKLKMFYDYGYNFKEEHREHCNELIIVFDQKAAPYDKKTIENLIKYGYEQFPHTKIFDFRGESLTLSHYFNCTKFIKEEIDENNKIEVKYDKPKDVLKEDESDIDSEEESDRQYSNYSHIKLNDVEIVYHNKTEKVSMFVAAQLFDCCFYNNHWVQVGDYVYITEFFDLKLRKIKFIESEMLKDKVENYEDIAFLKDPEIKLFLMLKINMNMLVTTQPDKWYYDNKGFTTEKLVEVSFKSVTKAESDLREFNDDIENIDPLLALDVFIYTFVDFSTDEGQRLLNIILTKRHGRFYGEDFLTKEKSLKEGLLLFLENPTGKIDSLLIKVPKPSFASLIFDAIKNNMRIDFVSIKTKKKVSSNTEKKAMKFIDKRIGAVVELNSKHKLLRYMNRRGVTKYYNSI